MTVRNRGSDDRTSAHAHLRKVTLEPPAQHPCVWCRYEESIDGVRLCVPQQIAAVHGPVISECPHTGTPGAGLLFCLLSISPTAVDAGNGRSIR